MATMLMYKGLSLNSWLIRASAEINTAMGGGYGPAVTRQIKYAMAALRNASKANRAPKGQEEDYRMGRLSSGHVGGKKRHVGRLGAAVSRLNALTR